jgi:hypothetical protein
MSLFITELSFVTQAPYHLKRRDDATFLLSTVQPQGGSFKVFNLVAYRYLSDAVAAGHVRQKARRSKQA